ncbi:Crp/Fnr family transcriptional regulator [Chondrinema litorale]|uniref:Crp/Fnr family transcriptional regulator n=1 Tax=Chondrinema litorale TaxID=2994555 RepID=UPI002542DD8E|nr:Crp/Fnr family transcriptional regulator [Chondrinema litorale]UZR98902.1 Crp/Fnr family transcriptional regulator [Chondrinema litorale]UZR99597.1 Crp/Fnr family transcriptional regulator [Chondrinema litorale]
MINIAVLKKYEASETFFKKDEIIFREGNKALFYWQIYCGTVKMVNYSPDGKEFTQGIFNKGESFGEPPLFTDLEYPSNAVAVDDVTILKLPIDNFLLLLKENFEIHKMLTKTLCNRLHYKSMMMREIASHPPEHRIISLIDYFKNKETDNKKLFEVSLTRQQIADMTGLRVETVIRSIKSLQEKGEVKIINRKVYR